jgi:hypothetical protein
MQCYDSKLRRDLVYIDSDYQDCAMGFLQTEGRSGDSSSNSLVPLFHFRSAYRKTREDEEEGNFTGGYDTRA